MYDFHDSTDIFVNPSFLPFCTQKAPWISSKNRSTGAYVHYKICPKMSVELWKLYIVRPTVFFLSLFSQLQYYFFFWKKGFWFRFCPRQLTTNCPTQLQRGKPWVKEIPYGNVSRNAVKQILCKANAILARHSSEIRG